MNLFCMTGIILENYFDAIIWGENCVKTYFQCKNKIRNNVNSKKEFAEFIELNYILTIFALIKTITYAFEYKQKLQLLIYSVASQNELVIFVAALAHMNFATNNLSRVFE